jgi:hypothetical protein
MALIVPREDNFDGAAMLFQEAFWWCSSSSDPRNGIFLEELLLDKEKLFSESCLAILMAEKSKEDMLVIDFLPPRRRKLSVGVS